MLVIHLEEPEWDISNSSHLCELLAPAMNEPHAVLDMAEVTYIDSSSLAVLTDMYRQRVIERGFAPSHLVVPARGIRRLLEITGLDNIWQLHTTLAEALAAAQAEEHSDAGPQLGPSA